MVATIYGGSDEDLGVLMAWDASRAPESLRAALLECQRAVGALSDASHGEGCPDRACERCSVVGRLVEAAQDRQHAMQRILRECAVVPENFDSEARAVAELARAARWARRKVGTDGATWGAVMRGQMPAPGGD